MKEEKLKIEFELTGSQAQVLTELLKIPQNAGKTPNEACRVLVVQCLINAKQQLVAQELGQGQ